MGFSGAKVLVTGATGLIGRTLCERLLQKSAHVVALVRNAERAAKLLPRGCKAVLGDVIAPIALEDNIDYIVHGAGPTASRDFVEHPVEVIDAIVGGARNILEFARMKAAKGLVFLSTMEVYGLTNSEDVDETRYAALDTMLPRNCYPEGKRLAECLFASAAREYGIHARIARLTQTFGRGVGKDDARVFAEFARAVRDGRDIILKSDGSTARCYCSVIDAAEAICLLLEKGNDGMAYNVANPETYCTIREMAELVSREFSGGRSRVVIDETGADACGYLPSFKMKLNVEKIKALGWTPRHGLREMFAELLHGWN